MLKPVGVFVVIIFASCNSSYQPVYEKSSGSIDPSSVNANEKLTVQMAGYKSIRDQEMNSIIGFCDTLLQKGNPEGLLGNFVADAVFNCAVLLNNSFNEKNSIALLNNGGLRTTVNFGEVTRGEIFELMPFENYLTVVELKGNVILTEMMSYISSKKGQPVSRNVKIDLNEPLSFFVANVPVNPDSSYYIITSDYLAAGGDNMLFMTKAVNSYAYNKVKIRDIIIQQFIALKKTNQKINGKLEGRIKLKQ